MGATNPRETPYKGLVPYAETDYRLFFGRESERDIITANIMGSRLTLVYGPSGVGKSSVLRAGVVHGIRSMAHEEVKEFGTPNFIVTFFNQWRDEPLIGLRNEIRHSVENAIGKMPSIPPNLTFAEELTCLAESVTGKLLIILDQFEEYFLYPQKDGPGSFAYEFPKALSRPDVRANFIVSLREDWYTKLDRFKTSIPHLFENNLRLDWLNREGARQAIEEPVRIYNEELKNGSPEVRITAGFASEVINQLEALAEDVLSETGTCDLKVSKGKGSIQTPYLQLVMSQLWSEAIKQPVPELDPSMLKSPVSGERGATRSEEIIQSHLDSMMRTLSAEEQDVAARAFYHLVTPGGTKIAQQIGDLGDYTGITGSTLNDVLAKLSSKEMSILTQLMPPPNKPSNQVRYELFHDVLASAVLNWRTRFNAERAQEKAKAVAASRMQQERAAAAQRAAEKEKELKAAHERAEIERQRAEDQKARVEAESRARLAEQERAEAEKIRAEDHLRTSKRLGRLSLGLAALVLFSVGASVFAGAMWYRSDKHKRAALAGEENARKFAEESKELRLLGAQAESRAIEMEAAAKRNLETAEDARADADAAEKRAKVDRATAQAASAKAQQLQAIAADLNQKAQDARQAAANSQEETDEAQKLNVLYQNALFRYRNKDYQGTIDILTQALPSIKSGSKDLAYALNIIGYSHTDLADPGKAIDSYNKALALFRDNGDYKGELYTLQNIGDAYATIDGATAKDVAAQYYNEASSKYEKVGSFADAGEVQLKVAKLYADEKSDKEKMITAYQAAIAAFDKGGQSAKAASTHLELGDVYVPDNSADSPYASERPNAELEYRKALKIYEDKRDTENSSRTLVKIAKLFENAAEETDKEKSYKAYAEAASLNQRAGNFKEEGRVLTFLAVIQSRHQKLDLAECNFEDAAKAFERASDPSGQARTWRSIASLNNCQTCDETKKRKAVNLHRQAIAVYEKMGQPSAADRRYWNASLRSIIALYKTLGENELAAEYQKKLAAALKKDPE